MRVLDDLKAARELIADESRWTQGAFALTVDGSSVDPRSDIACRWCLAGAAWRIAGGAWKDGAILPRYAAMLKALFPEPDSEDVEGLVTEANDNGDHASTLGVIDAAIERLARAGAGS